MLGTLLQSVFNRQTVRALQRPFFRPRVEQLEDRLAPAVFLVTDPGDGVNQGTLRWAIGQVNQSMDAQNTINFDPTRLTGATISAKTGQLPTIVKNVSINGLGSANLTVQRDPTAGMNFSVFRVDASAVVTISGLKISGGRGTGADGGGIYNLGNLTLTNDLITLNQVNGPGAKGGGIWSGSNATLTLNGTTVTENQALGGATSNGGGIYNFGILNVNPSSQILTNNADGNGGGIYNDLTGSTTIASTTLSGNKAVGGDGGGIYNNNRLQIRTSSLWNNQAPKGNGGGVFTAGSAFIGNTTLQENTANKGAGMYGSTANAVKQTTLDHVTDMQNNSVPITPPGSAQRAGALPPGSLPGIGGGIYIEDGAEVDIVNTIIAMNTASDLAPDVFGVVNSQGFNLIGIGDDSSGWIPGLDMVGTSASPIDPLLNPLGDYGGPTLSMTLQAGSPALMAGNPAADDSPTDQRGFARVVNGFTDIGAVEMQPGELGPVRRR